MVVLRVRREEVGFDMLGSKICYELSTENTRGSARGFGVVSCLKQLG